MSIIIDAAHLQHFKKNHSIEFENILSESQIQLILAHFSVRASHYSPPYPLKVGFNHWREDVEVEKIICSYKLAKLAGQLMDRMQLRFGFSQYLSRKCYCNDFAFLNRKSCIKEFIGGLCICLEPTQEPENPYFPMQKGNAIFFEMDEEFYLRFPKTEGKYLFIFYAHPKASYTHQSQDPLNPLFRELGYEQGDRLKAPLNPSFSWMPV